MRQYQPIQVAHHTISPLHRPFVIAEMSGNHNQSLDRALEIVDAVADAGAHALKLQTYTPDTITFNGQSDEFYIRDTQSLWQDKNLYKLYEQAYTPWEWHKPIFDHAKKRGMVAFSSPFDTTAVDFLESLDVPLYKIASFENTDHILLKKIAKTGKPVIMSTGVSSVADLDESVKLLREHGCRDLILLKCTSTYPATPESTNLRTIPHMRELFDVPVGLSDHTMGIGAAVAAVALGAVVIEKHVTLRRADGGVDSAFSLEPDELKNLVIESERAFLAMGQVSYTQTPKEQKSRQFKRSLYVVQAVEAGEPFTPDNVRSIRPANGLHTRYYDEILGQTVTHSPIRSSKSMGIIQRQTIQSTVFTYAGTVLGFVTTTLLIPRVMNLDQVGLINLLPSWMILLSYLANLGINGAANRYFTYFRDYNRQHNGFLLVSIGVSLVGFLLAMGLLVAFKPIILESNQERSVLFADNYYLLIPLTFSLLFFNLFDTYAKLLYDTVTGTLLQQVVQRVLTLAVVGAYGLNWLSFHQFLMVWLLTWLLPAGLMAAKIGVDRQFHLNRRFVSVTPEMRRQLATYSSLTLLTGLSSQVIVQIDKIMVNQALGLAAVAIYATCSNFGIVIAIPATALYKVSGVIIADSWKNNDLANISLIYRKSCLNQLLIGSLVFVGIAANLPNLFRILPPAYEAGYFVILWLGAGKLIDMATGVNGLILNTSRYYAYDTLFFAILVVSTIALTYYGVKLAGLNGAAVAAALATVIFNAGRTWFVWYKFDLQPFGWQNAAVLGVAGLTWGLAAVVPYLAISPVWLAVDIAVRSAGITVLFVGLAYALKLSPDANQMLLSLTRRLNRFS